jgi:hypothetical protein
MADGPDKARIPTSIRLPEVVEDAVRAAALRSGRSLAAELRTLIERGLGGHLTGETGDPEVDALKVIAASVIEDFAWTVVGGHEGDAKLTLNLVKASLAAVLDQLGAAKELSPDLIAIGEREAANVWAKLQGPPETPLGRAGVALRIGKPEAKS